MTNEDMVAQRGREALEVINTSRTNELFGWIRYGQALLEGREMFPRNELFGAWRHTNKLCDTRCRLCPKDRKDAPNYHKASAALWAAKNRDHFEEAQKQNLHVKSIRALVIIAKEMKEDTERDPVAAQAMQGLRNVGAGENEMWRGYQIMAEAVVNIIAYYKEDELASFKWATKEGLVKSRKDFDALIWFHNNFHKVESLRGLKRIDNPTHAFDTFKAMDLS